MVHATPFLVHAVGYLTAALPTAHASGRVRPGLL